MRALLRTVTGSPRVSPASKTAGAGAVRQPNVNDVVKRWNAVKIILDKQSQQPSNKTGPTTAIEGHLDAIVDALIQEAALLSSSETTGECMEWILTNDTLNALVTSACTDTPIGLLSITLKAFDNMVTLLSDDFAAFSHKPLLRLVLSTASRLHSNESDAGPENRYEAELTSLLCSICARTKAYPELLPILFHEKRRPVTDINAGLVTGKTLTLRHAEPRSPSTSSVTSTADPSPFTTPSPSPRKGIGKTVESEPTLPSTGVAGTEEETYELPIFSILLNFLHREGKVGEFARQGLLFLVDLATAKAPILPKVDKRDRRKSRFLSQAALQASPTLPAFQRHLADSSLPEVLGAALGAAFGLLPRKVFLSPNSGLGVEDGETRKAGALVQLEQLRAKDSSIATDAEAKEPLRHFLRLFDFAQDVLRRIGTSMYQATALDHDSHLCRLQRKLHQGIHRAFLENTIHPNVLEACSSSESTSSQSATDPLVAVALIHHLQSLLQTLDFDLPLADEVVEFLLGKPTYKLDSDALARQSDPSDAPTVPSQLVATAPTLSRSLGSTSSEGKKHLLTLDGSARTPKQYSFGIFSPLRSREGSVSTGDGGTTHRVQATNFDGASAPNPDMESPSFKGLLFNQMACSSKLSYIREQCLTSVLGFCLTILEKADVWTLELLDIVPDPRATTFPCGAEDGGSAEAEDNEEEFRYPGVEQESETSSFEYPSMSPMQAVPKALGRDNTERSPGNHAPARKGPSELELLVCLMPPSVNSVCFPKVEDGRALVRPFTISPSYEAYLRDAEVNLVNETCFRQGVGLATAAANGASTPGARPDSTEHRSSPSSIASMTDGRSKGDQHRMLRHRLAIDGDFLRHTRGLLCMFFANSPQTNLALTAVIARLAICPYRGLQPWLVGPGERCLTNLHDLGLLDLVLNLDTVTSHTRSAPVSKTPTSLGRDKSSAALGPGAASQLGAESLIQVFTQLLDMVQSYGTTVDGFESYLAERRQSLLFVDDLAEAMQGNTLSKTRASDVVPQSDSATAAPRLSKTLLTPLISTTRMSRQESTLSPYTEHYRRTASIMVKPLIVADTAKSHSPHSVRRTSFSNFSRDPSVSEVNLSSILDNVIILEEAVKEVVAIVVIRKSLGIDKVSIV